MKIELRNIHKYFGSVHANSDISYTLNEGRIIGVLGENGAGKSTLMKILSGFQPASQGSIFIDDVQANYSGPIAAIAQGIGMLQQDPLDIQTFTVLENFIFNDNLPGIRLDKKKARQLFKDVCNRVGFDIDDDLLISELSIAQRQQLEIIRLLSMGVKTLILDEPTTGISAEQKDLLFGTLTRLAAQDKITILLVSHKLEDVISLCDEVFVLRQGKLVGRQDMPASKAELVALMFDQELNPPVRRQIDFSQAPIHLQFQNLDISDNRLDIKKLNIDIHRGEIIGLAGLDGSGQELFMRACVGLHPLQSGKIQILEKDFTKKSYKEYMRNGIVFGAAGRVEEGLIAGLTLTEHIALISELKGSINWKRARTKTEELIQHYKVKGEPDDEIQQLSGGNQQRVLMSMMPEDATALFLEQPTRGLDVDSAKWIWEQLLERCARGSALVFSSADLDELISYSDRIIVFFAGQTYLVNDVHHLSSQELGHLIGGAFD